MSDLLAYLKDLAVRHEEAMKTDPRYRMTFWQMWKATRPTDPPERDRHYDRDGHCDNPARGY